MPYLYKQLTSSDVKQLKELLKIFGQAFGENGTYQKFVPKNAYLKRLLAKNSFITIVALNKNKVIGGLTAYVLEKFEQDRKEIFIYDLAISKEYRRKGVATNLIKKLKAIAKNLEAYVIFVQADTADSPAIKLYESLGTKTKTYNFDITLKK
jgi:aminoglycoside 3-N-acetyltransferase I